jgi:hypothetical protein
MGTGPYPDSRLAGNGERPAPGPNFPGIGPGAPSAESVCTPPGRGGCGVPLFNAAAPPGFKLHRGVRAMSLPTCFPSRIP